ncbi:MAG: BMP family ABC transporter substrate-binding protein [Methanoregulaceae archaeon]|nr:BMP family ABC transporter substrate-binding protein [Methanoregulaceae archaeon]
MFLEKRVLLVLAAAVVLLVSAAFTFLLRDDGLPLVFLVYDSEEGDLSYTDNALRGLLAAANETKFRHRVFVLPERDLFRRQIAESSGPERPGLVITVGYNFAESTRQWAEENPDISFLAIDQSSSGAKNVRAEEFTAYGSSYLAGILAANATKTGRVGIVLGAPSTVLDSFLAGYRDGAGRSVAVDVKYIANDTSGFMDPDRAGEIAASMYLNGTDVIYTVAGFSGTGAIREAEKAPGRYIIGVDSDQSGLGPSVVLASAVKRVDVAVHTGIVRYLNGTFTPGEELLGLSSGGTDLVFNPAFSGFEEGVMAGRDEAEQAEARYLAIRVTGGNV